MPAFRPEPRAFYTQDVPGSSDYPWSPCPAWPGFIRGGKHYDERDNQTRGLPKFRVGQSVLYGDPNDAEAYIAAVERDEKGSFNGKHELCDGNGRTFATSVPEAQLSAVSHSTDNNDDDLLLALVI